MGVMLRRIEQSRPLRRQHFEPREPGIGRASSARDRRERHGRKLPSVQDGDDLLRISNRLAPASARFCRLRCSCGCSFAFLCLDGWGPWPEGINGLCLATQHIYF